MPANGFHSITLRAQALTFLGIGYTYAKTSEITGIPAGTLKDLKKRARDRGWDPAVDPRMRDEYVADAKRSGRPSKSSDETNQQLTE
jgi:transposase